LDYYPIIAERFQATLESVAMSVDQLAEPLGQAAELLTASLLQDRKIMVCAGGIDASLAQLFTTALLSRLDDERPALPALNLAGDGGTLAAIAATEGPDAVFARQLQALGQPGDALLLIAGGDPAPALPAALQAALERDMPVVALVTDADRELVQRLPAGAAVIRSGAGTRSRVLEMHTMILLALCQLIDIGLFGPRD
jgi:D-sedoheptulose 7-phosphate isomerase